MGPKYSIKKAGLNNSSLIGDFLPGPSDYDPHKECVLLNNPKYSIAGKYNNKNDSDSTPGPNDYDVKYKFGSFHAV